MYFIDGESKSDKKSDSKSTSNKTVVKKSSDEEKKSAEKKAKKSAKSSDKEKKLEEKKTRKVEFPLNFKYLLSNEYIFQSGGINRELMYLIESRSFLGASASPNISMYDRVKAQPRTKGDIEKDKKRRKRKRRLQLKEKRRRQREKRRKEKKERNGQDESEESSSSSSSSSDTSSSDMDDSSSDSDDDIDNDEDTERSSLFSSDQSRSNSDDSDDSSSQTSDPEENDVTNSDDSSQQSSIESSDEENHKKKKKKSKSKKEAKLKSKKSKSKRKKKQIDTESIFSNDASMSSDNDESVKSKNNSQAKNKQIQNKKKDSSSRKRQNSTDSLFDTEESTTIDSTKSQISQAAKNSNNAGSSKRSRTDSSNSSVKSSELVEKPEKPKKRKLEVREDSDEDKERDAKHTMREPLRPIAEEDKSQVKASSASDKIKKLETNKKQKNSLSSTSSSSINSAASSSTGQEKEEEQHMTLGNLISVKSHEANKKKLKQMNSGKTGSRNDEQKSSDSIRHTIDQSQVDEAIKHICEATSLQCNNQDDVESQVQESPVHQETPIVEEKNLDEKNQPIMEVDDEPTEVKPVEESQPLEPVDVKESMEESPKETEELSVPADTSIQPKDVVETEIKAEEAATVESDEIPAPKDISPKATIDQGKKDKLTLEYLYFNFHQSYSDLEEPKPEPKISESDGENSTLEYSDDEECKADTKLVIDSQTDQVQQNVEENFEENKNVLDKEMIVEPEPVLNNDQPATIVQSESMIAMDNQSQQFDTDDINKSDMANISANTETTIASDLNKIEPSISILVNGPGVGSTSSLLPSISPIMKRRANSSTLTMDDLISQVILTETDKPTVINESDKTPEVACITKSVLEPEKPNILVEQVHEEVKIEPTPKSITPPNQPTSDSSAAKAYGNMDMLLEAILAEKPLLKPPTASPNVKGSSEEKKQSIVAPTLSSLIDKTIVENYDTSLANIHPSIEKSMAPFQQATILQQAPAPQIHKQPSMDSMNEPSVEQIPAKVSKPHKHHHHHHHHSGGEHHQHSHHHHHQTPEPEAMSHHQQQQLSSGPVETKPTNSNIAAQLNTPTGFTPDQVFLNYFHICIHYNSKYITFR